VHGALLDRSVDDGLSDASRARLARHRASVRARFPLWIGNSCAGMLAFYTREAEGFSEATLRLGAEIALQTALAIQNAQLLEESQRYAAEQSALLRVSRAVATSLDLGEVMNEVAKASLAIAGAECCEIELLDSAAEETVLVAAQTLPRWTIGTTKIGKRLPLRDWSLTQKVMTTKTALIVDETCTELTDSERRFLMGERQQSTLFLPMVAGDRCLGMVACYAEAKNAFSEDSIRLGLDLASQGAIAIDRLRMHSALQRQANTDSLTGLLNHRAIQERLDQEITRASRSGQNLAVLMVDLNRFKYVNDTHGHQVGDRVLRRVARLLQASVREYDEVGRYGGDEFLLVLPDTGAVEAVQIADRIIGNATHLNSGESNADLAVGFAIGVAIYPVQADSRQALIEFADQEMYESKRQAYGRSGQVATHGTGELRLKSAPGVGSSQAAALLRG
jgi:diguanylate cyclase (GGDEF)-like protein